MFKRTKACYDFVCSDPKGCWEGFKIFGGVAVAFLAGCVYYGILGLIEKLTGKDFFKM